MDGRTIERARLEHRDLAQTDRMTEVPNIYVSNGTCYSGRHNEADPSMIPCGNDYFGRTACCQASDTCLESSACFNGQYYVTYVAACTDPEYEHESCPDKFKDIDAPWLGMSYCNGTSDEWVLCAQTGHPGTIVSPDPCSCPTATAERTMTLAQSSHINNTASLPSATGLSIAFQPGYYPSATAAPIDTTGTSLSTRASSSVSTTIITNKSESVSPTATSLPSAQPSTTTPGLSKTATIGTAVGASIFGLLLLAGLGYFLVCRRRKKQRELDNASNDTKDPPHPGGEAAAEATAGGTTGRRRRSSSSSSSRRRRRHNAIDTNAYGGSGVSGGGSGHDMNDISQMSMSSPHHSHISELENKAARPWSMVSELDGSSGGGAQRPMSMVVGASPGRMEAIMEQQVHGNGLGYGYSYGYGYGYALGQEQGQGEAGPSELPTSSIAELPG